MRLFFEADKELSDHFTSAIGVRAQSYEPTSSSAFNSDDAHIALRDRGYRQALERFHSVLGTLTRLPTTSRMVIERVYGPGAGVLDDDAHQIDAGLTQDPLGILKLALAPSWGHGTYMRLVLEEERAVRAFQRRFPERSPARSSVLDFLAFEAGKGRSTEAFFARLRGDCDKTRQAALTVYDSLRRARVSHEKQAAKQRRDERERQLEDALGKKRRREAERFEMRLRRSS